MGRLERLTFAEISALTKQASNWLTSGSPEEYTYHSHSNEVYIRIGSLGNYGILVEDWDSNSHKILGIDTNDQNGRIKHLYDWVANAYSMQKTNQQSNALQRVRRLINR